VRDSRGTQRAEILGLLISAGGAEVPLPKITECAAQYNARIFELRRAGFRIKNRTQEVNGARHSWFWLESTPTSRTITPADRPSETLALFTEECRP